MTAPWVGLHGCSPHLPPPALAEEQAGWLAGARARLLRRAGVAHRRRVLEVGPGWGAVTDELSRRCDGAVVAVDRDPRVRTGWAARHPHSLLVLGDGSALPFPDETFDLIFSQNVLLWTAGLEETLAEFIRVLGEGGAVVWLEPDYGGLLEHPPEVAVRELWIAGLSRAGADPFVGRKVAPLLEAAGLIVRAEVPPVVEPPSSARFTLLEGLPLSETERQRLRERRQCAENRRHTFVYLPYVLGMATKAAAG